jgi:superfamily II DNA or RNA helicase
MISETLKAKLRPWQHSILEASLSGMDTGNFLNASGLGSGKSFVSLATTYARKRKPIFICRLAMKERMREIAVNHFGFADADVCTTNIEAIRTGKHFLGSWTYGEAHPNTGKREKIFQWNVPSDADVIVDEIHSCSSMTSQNSILLRSAVEQGVKLMGLSGTAADDPRRMRAIGYMLGLHSDYDFWGWMSLYGATEESWTFGLKPAYLETRKGREELERKRREAMAKIHQQLIKAGRMVRLRTSDIPGFPKSSVHPMAVDFNSKEMASILEEMKFELAELKRKGTGRSQLEIMMRARQRSELLMVPTLAEMISDAIEEGNSVAMFLNFTATIRALGERLKTNCFYTGEESVAERQHNHARYMADKERAILINSAAGSESIGFQDEHGNYPRLGIVVPDFRAVMLNQILGRLPRDGAKTPSTYWLIFPRGTVLHHAYLACQKRTELYGAFNGDITFTDDDLTAGLPI